MIVEILVAVLAIIMYSDDFTITKESVTSRQIDNGKPVMVHSSGGKGRTGTILAAYLIKKRNVLNAYQAIYKLRNIRGESIQSKEQENILFEYEKYLEVKDH